MRTTATARRFARALIEVGLELDAYEKFGEQISDAAAVFKATPELAKVLLNPMYGPEERSGLIEKVASAIEASPEVARFLSILVETRNIRQLEAISAAYSALTDELSGRIRAVVEAPFELPDDLLGGIREKLKDSTGKDVVLGFVKKPDLLGGLVVRMENTVLDGSLKTQLELMKEKILEGVV